MSSNIVVSKFGSSLNASVESGPRQDKIDDYVEKVVANNTGSSHIFVVSGAKVIGEHRAKELIESAVSARMTDQQFAGLGATILFSAYEQACARIGMAASSYAVTHHLLEAIDDPELVAEKTSFVNVLSRNAELGITSIINEADALNDKELMRLIFGQDYEIDNDLLAAHVAVAVNADKLTLWKKGGGIRDDEGVYIGEINEENLQDCYAMLKERKEGKSGRGGPTATLDALVMATRYGIDSIATGISEDMLGLNTTRVVLG